MATFERTGVGAVHFRDGATVKPATATNPIKRLIAWIWSTHRTRRAVRELMALDDRSLADMGLSRGEAAYVVRHGRERGN